MALLAATLTLCGPAPWPGHGVAFASPPANRILKEHRAFMKAAMVVEARIRVQRGDGRRSPLLLSAHAALRQITRLERGLDPDAPVSLTPEPPPGQDGTLTIRRDRTFTLALQDTAPSPTPSADDDAPSQDDTPQPASKRSDPPSNDAPGDARADAPTLDLKALKLRRHPAEQRALALALAVTRLDRAARRMDTRLENEVLTLDRIDDRLVWAVGGESMAVWLDREIYRPARLYIGPEVLDEHTWTIQMHYGDDKPGRGWFPYRIEVLRDDSVVMIVHTLDVTLRRR